MLRVSWTVVVTTRHHKNDAEVANGEVPKHDDESDNDRDAANPMSAAMFSCRIRVGAGVTMRPPIVSIHDVLAPRPTTHGDNWAESVHDFYETPTPLLEPRGWAHALVHVFPVNTKMVPYPIPRGGLWLSICLQAYPLRGYVS